MRVLLRSCRANIMNAEHICCASASRSACLSLRERVPLKKHKRERNKLGITNLRITESLCRVVRS